MHGSQPLRKQDLSLPRRGLLELCQRLNFGRIERFQIRKGEPHATPVTRVLRELKFPGENAPRSEADRADFALKAQVVELFAAFESLGNGDIDYLEVKHGLPFRVVIEEDAAF
jgi:hypothetical protein